MLGDSPTINPYPNWEAHSSVSFSGSKTQLISPIRVKVDNCNRLWVLDTGIEANFVRSGPRIIIYNLTDDQHIDTIEIPKDAYVAMDSKLQNFVIDSNKCDNTFAYIADSEKARLIVYSYKTNETWTLKHNFFNFDPSAGDYNISDVNFQSSNAIFGLALGADDANGNADLYFHPMSSNSEFRLSTVYLRNKTVTGTLQYQNITLLGQRSINTQSGVSVFNKKKNVIFYTLLTRHSIGCWQTSKQYSFSKDNEIVVSSDLMYTSELTIDESDHLWALSNNYHKFDVLNASEINFRILWGSANEIIKGSLCDPDKSVDSKDGKNGNNSSSLQPIIHIISVALLLSFLRQLLL